MANTLKFGNSEWYGSEGNILAYNDENGNFKPLPFDFSRNSSATVVNKLGLIETVGVNDARVDYLNNAKGALLLEPTRTNYQPYSTNFSSWGIVDVTVGLNYGLSPDGFNNSVLVTEGTGSTQHRILKGSPTSSGIYTLSCFVKNKVGNRQAYIDMGAVTGFFNFDTKTMFSAAGTTSVESFSNDWYRISITSNTNVTPTANYLGTGKNNIETFQGDGSSAIEFFAPQLELGSYPTSYIPTQGTAQTRLADSCSQTTPDGVIGQTEGVLYCEVDVKSGYDTNNLMVTLSDTGAEQIYINRSNGKLEFFITNALVYVSPSILTNGVHKLALAYKQNDFAVAIDGVVVHTDNSGNVPTCNKINVGSHFNGNLPFNDRVNDVKLYNTRLSNSELAALTQV